MDQMTAATNVQGNGVGLKYSTYKGQRLKEKGQKTIVNILRELSTCRLPVGRQGRQVRVSASRWKKKRISY